MDPEELMCLLMFFRRGSDKHGLSEYRIIPETVPNLAKQGLLKPPPLEGVDRLYLYTLTETGKQLIENLLFIAGEST